MTEDGGIEFDWDDANRKHLAAHKVTPAEFETVMLNGPLDLACEVVARSSVTDLWVSPGAAC